MRLDSVCCFLWRIFFDTQRNLSLVIWIGASPQQHSEELLSTFMDVVVDAMIFRRMSRPSISLPRRLWSGRGKQLALLFQLFLLSGVTSCNLRRICGLVRPIITDYGAENLDLRWQMSLKNIAEQLHWKPPAANSTEL